MDAFEIIAPARLHFGLMSFGDPTRRQFGGVGAMLAEPALRVRFTPDTSWSFHGPDAERAERFAAHALERSGIPAERRRSYRVETRAAPPDHVGLGSGTQLALTIAYGALHGQDAAPRTLLDLVTAAGRGKRSSVGAYGFLHGGLIVEAGKLPGETLGPLIARGPFPPAWRVALLAPRREQGLHGAMETTAFAGLSAVPVEVAERLTAEATLELLPAVRTADFARFADAVYRYGHTAGECFAAAQGGPYADARIAALVARLRAAGVAGVGQSSWGPTVFAWFADECAAQDFLAEHATAGWALDCDTRIVAPATHGATIDGRPLAEHVDDGTRENG